MSLMEPRHILRHAVRRQPAIRLDLSARHAVLRRATLPGAAKAYLIFHPLLAAWSTYALGRALGLGRLGAFVAALAYANSGFLQIQNSCCFAFASIYAWLPLSLLGAECALHATRLTTRAACGDWPESHEPDRGGMARSGYVLRGADHRRLRCVSDLAGAGGRGKGGRAGALGRLLQHEAGVFVFGAALAAAGLLPRIEFNAYRTWLAATRVRMRRVGGLRPEQWVFLVMPGSWYVGASVLVLAAAAPFLVRGCLGRPVWYFGATSFVALILSDTFETPWTSCSITCCLASRTCTHMHPSGFSPSPTSARPCWPEPRSLLRTTWAGGSVGCSDLASSGCGCHDGGARRHGGSRSAVEPAARAGRALRDPLDGIAALAPVDLSMYYQPAGAAAFSSNICQTPFRYFGYAPDVGGQPVAYNRAIPGSQHRGPGGQQLCASARLYDIQGYDASHLRRYDSFLAELKRPDRRTTTMPRSFRAG